MSLDPNGEHIKLRWSKDDEPPSPNNNYGRQRAGSYVRMEEGNGAFDEIASKLFQIDAAHREPCPEP